MGAAYGGAGVTEKQRQADDDLLQNQARMVGERFAATYDLVNAGPRRRFTVRGAGGEVLLVHNCENAAQAASRDLLVNALFNFEEAGIPTVGTVHDEIISEVDGGSLDEARSIMCQLPAWAAGLPVAAEGWQARRYRK